MTTSNDDSVRYDQFYTPAIREHLRGFKLAPGGTGLGKTSAIRSVIDLQEFSQKKFLYLANLRQLVEDVGNQKHCLILRSDRDSVLFTLRDKKQAFYELFQDEDRFRVYISRWNEIHRNMKIDLTKVKRACQAFETLLAEHTTIPSSMEDQMSEHAGVIMHCFRAAVQGAQTKRGTSPGYLFLLDHPIIQSLFPFIAFKRRPEIRLIALTVQKAYYGFFDGQKMLNLTRLEEEDGGYIIFMDEFDFLENTLVHLICASAQISDPFDFVQRFCVNMEEHKLPHTPYPSSLELREHIVAIYNVIKDLQKETGLLYPTKNHFTSTIPKLGQNQGRGRQSSQAIFRTQHIVRTAPLAVRQTERGFELYTAFDDEDDQDDQGHRALSALRLFDAVSYACDLIIRFFRTLRWSNDDLLYQEIMRHCFHNTIYPGELERITQYALHHHQEDGTDLGALLERGYSVYDIFDLQQVTDPEEVEVRHYGMHLTPETILRSLAQHNLVFGLSATADIPRFVQHFHLAWAHQHMEIHDSTPEDTELIRILNKQKADKRNNTVTLDVLSGLSATDEYQHLLTQYIRQVARDEEFGDDRSGYLKQRVELFFSVLLDLYCQQPEQEQVPPLPGSSQGISTSLLFLNTFKQIRLLFERYPQPESGIFRIVKRLQSFELEAYELEIKGHSLLIVFYNARQGNKMRQLASVQKEFDQLFWEGKSVVVVTQFKSAGIGINLQYWSSPEKTHKQDFTCIGLLETPYYYFGDPEDELDEGEKRALLKENIWYLGKLYTGKLISLREFRQMLTTLHHSSSWNNDYHNSNLTRHDALLNAMATFIQALGRIEREWTQMPNQRVFLSREVYQYFQRFCSPEFELLREDRDAFVSDNLRQIFKHVSDALPKEKRAAYLAKDARLPAKNKSCEDAISLLLVRLEKVRQGHDDPDARSDWQQLRKAVLKHEYRNPVLQRYECVAESPHYQNGMLYLTRENEILPSHLTQIDTFTWNMDHIYRIVKDNQVIREYFQEQGYRLHFPPGGKHFLTPYCFQAILKGAIGEEAITALLQDEGIHLEDLPQVLTEVADLKIRNHPYYIDCKFYNEFTLKRFSLPEDDPDWHEKLNDGAFRENAVKKVERLQAQHNTPVKIIYLNLVTQGERDRRYFDLDFQEVSFEQASIIVVQGALQWKKPNVYQPAFEYFLRDFRRALSIEEQLQPFVQE